MHINSSSSTRTDADNAEIKFMFSSEWFTLAVAQALDLGAAAASLPAWTTKHESQDIAVIVQKGFSMSFTFFPQSVHLCLAFICICLSDH